MLITPTISQLGAYQFEINLASAVNCLTSVTINWGDGNTATIPFTGGAFNSQHDYEDVGDYQIVVTVLDACGNDANFDLSATAGCNACLPNCTVYPIVQSDGNVLVWVVDNLHSLGGCSGEIEINDGNGNITVTPSNGNEVQKIPISYPPGSGPYQLDVRVWALDGAVRCNSYHNIQTIPDFDCAYCNGDFNFDITNINYATHQINCQFAANSQLGCTSLFLIDWGDGTAPLAIIPDMLVHNYSHTYASAGLYTITVYLRDDVCGVWRENFVVANLDLNCSVCSPSGSSALLRTDGVTPFTTEAAGTQAYYKLQINALDGNCTKSVIIDWGDGSTPVFVDLHNAVLPFTSPVSGNFVHMYNTPGSYTANFTVQWGCGTTLVYSFPVTIT